MERGRNRSGNGEPSPRQKAQQPADGPNTRSKTAAASRKRNHSDQATSMSMTDETTNGTTQGTFTSNAAGSDATQQQQSRPSIRRRRDDTEEGEDGAALVVRIRRQLSPTATTSRFDGRSNWVIVESARGPVANGNSPGNVQQRPADSVESDYVRDEYDDAFRRFLVNLSQHMRVLHRSVASINAQYRRRPSAAVRPPPPFGDEVWGSSRGLTVSQIGRLPIRLFQATDGNGGSDATQCLICHTEYQASERLRVLGFSCQHQFHALCLDEWLKESASCPICRASVGV